MRIFGFLKKKLSVFFGRLIKQKNRRKTHALVKVPPHEMHPVFEFGNDFPRVSEFFPFKLIGLFM